MGVGKTTIGAAIAQKLNLPFHDTDDLFFNILGIDGGEYIKNYGIEAFREAEKKLILNYWENLSGVVSTGAGSWTIPEVRMISKKDSLVVWLIADARTLAARLSGSSRVLTKDIQDLYLFCSKQMNERNKYYEICDIKLITDNLSKDKIVLNLLNIVEKYI